ncbi:MAG: hypothetical protein LBT09_11920 [Planctomycetaceae bacterium]|nr:hypothetical protein [Planctomycetaceae bacterium]
MIFYAMFIFADKKLTSKLINYYNKPIMVRREVRDCFVKFVRLRDISDATCG